MADQPVTSLARAREQKINELSTHFANDDLTLEDLERRIERVYKATSVADLDAITADLRGLAPVPVEASRRGARESLAARSTPAAVATAAQPERSRILALMSSTRRVGRWLVPRALDVVAVMSDTRIDMTAAAIPSGVIDVDVHVIMASFKLIVPPNVRVINETHAFMADVRSRADELSPDATDPSAPVIRLHGLALMADVKVIVRRKEDAAYYDDDEDD